MGDPTRQAENAQERNWTRHIRRGRRGDPCVYCGDTPEQGKGTMDHVFPETLFDSMPDNVLTLPACCSCNGRKSGGDHVLQNYVTFHNNRHRSPSLKTQLEKIARATIRGQSPLGDAAQRAMDIRRQVDPFEMGGPIPIELGAAGEQLDESLSMIVRGLFFANHGEVLPSQVQTQVKTLTPEHAERIAEVFAKSPELWLSKQGEVEWAMFTAPSEVQSVLCVFSIDGVYFLGASGNFLSGEEVQSAV